MKYHARGDDEFDRLLTERTFNKSAETETTTFGGVVAIAIPRTIADIQDALALARRNKQVVSIRTGGHNWYDISLLGENVVLLDMRHFDSICIDGTTATVGPAVLGQTLNTAAAPYALCFPAGHCVGVPLGGYLLGGGFGWFQHAFGGMAAELVLAMTIVTANGQVLEQIRNDTHPDWMWLARGAAAAFPAVVVSFTLQLQPLAPILRQQTNLVLLEDYGRLVESLCRWQLDGKLSRQLELSVVPASTPPHFVELLQAALALSNNEEASCVPEKICIFNVYVMAVSEEEFAELIRPTQEMVVHCLYRTAFADATMSGLTELMGPVYPKGLSWTTRSYQVDLRATVDWPRLSRAFTDWAPFGYSHILTAIGPDHVTLGSGGGGGAYGTFVPGLVVAVYCATAVDAPPAIRHQCRELVQIVERVLEPVATKCNPLEHPVHRGTSTKCFPNGIAERVRQLRDELDPGHLLFDPSTIEPYT